MAKKRREKNRLKNFIRISSAFKSFSSRAEVPAVIGTVLVLPVEIVFDIQIRQKVRHDALRSGSPGAVSRLLFIQTAAASNLFPCFRHRTRTMTGLVVVAKPTYFRSVPGITLPDMNSWR